MAEAGDFACETCEELYTDAQARGEKPLPKLAAATTAQFMVKGGRETITFYCDYHWEQAFETAVALGYTLDASCFDCQADVN